MTYLAARPYLNIDSPPTLEMFLIAMEGVDLPISSEALEAEQPTFWTWLFPTAEHVQEEARVATRVKDFAKFFVKCKFFSPEERELIDRKWQIILDQACANIGESSRNTALFLESSKVRALFAELDGIILGINTTGVLPYGRAEMVEHEELRNGLKYLMHNVAHAPDVDHFFNAESTEQSQAEYLREVQSLLQHLYDLTQSPTPPDDAFLELMLGHALCFFYAQMGNPRPGSTIAIPQKIGDTWQRVACHVSLIPLTPGGEATAVGLTPIGTPGAQRLLLYKGTQGLLAHLADWLPFTNVGQLLYWLGGDNVRAWVTQAHQESMRPVKVYGISLGAALAHQTAQDLPNEVEIQAYASPGLLWGQPTAADVGAPHSSHKSYIDPNDYVSKLAWHPVGTQLIKVIRGEPCDFPLCHLRIYGGEATILLRVNIVWENQKAVRYVSAVLHQIASVPLSLLLISVLLIQGAYSQITALFQTTAAPTPLLGGGAL